jgi:hypothetical protein
METLFLTVCVFALAGFCFYMARRQNQREADPTWVRQEAELRASRLRVEAGHAEEELRRKAARLKLEIAEAEENVRKLREVEQGQEERKEETPYRT